MRQLKLFRWAAVLMLAIALAPAAASAEEDGTVTISGVFNIDYLGGDVDRYYPDLVAAYNNGHEHTWTLTLHDATQSHHATEIDYVELVQDTWIDATSFNLEFFGPDAATLNSIVSDHLAGGYVWILLRNHYSYYSDDDFTVMYVVAGGGTGVYFSTAQYYGSGTLFPTDANGYPVVGPEPFSIESDYTELGYDDWFSGNGWEIGSLGGLVTFEGRVGKPKPAVLAVADASVLEGDKGTTTVPVAVTLSSASSQAITVSYRTVDGTAKAKDDYTVTSGTLTFQPGETRRTISISIKADRKREADETFTVELSNPVGAPISNGRATVTILNDD